MLKIISAMKASQDIVQIMDEVSTASDTYIIEQGGMALVAIVPIKEYEQMQTIKERAWERLHKFMEKASEATKDVDPEVLEKEIQMAVEAVKKEELEEMKEKANLKAAESKEIYTNT
ncbi:MAG: type II toxin-antitoxin system Phd/YefM family antitoxin [Nitrospirae bacterium]|nr:type II toxin-antitoxin system Phd/YefM family antitoxin [Nitrospirota bacterium]MBF0590907.1 type II toxin-antitoxin system Phd/YefM family antitoxin [Nitrospirota bacterium]